MKTALFAHLLLLLAVLESRATGGLDATFGSGGKASVKISAGPDDDVTANDQAYDVHIRPLRRRR